MPEQTENNQEAIHAPLEAISKFPNDDIKSMMEAMLKGQHIFRFLNLKSYQSKRIIKHKIYEFLNNPEQVFINREPIQIDNYHHISIQASSMHYCRPKDNSGLYTHVEVGFPSFVFSPKFRKEYRLNDNIIAQMPLNPLIRELAGLMHKFKMLKLGRPVKGLQRPKKPKKSKAA